MISKKAVGSFVVFIIAVTVQKIYAEHTENKEVTQSANPVAATVTGSTDDNVPLTKEMESSKSKDKEDAENEPSKKSKKRVNNKDDELDNRPDTEGDGDYGNHQRIPVKGNLILYGGREKSQYGGRGKSRHGGPGKSRGWDWGMRKGNKKGDDDSEDAEGQGDKDKKKKSKAGAQDSGGKKSAPTEIPSPPPDEPQSAKDCAYDVQVSAFLVGMLMAFMLYGLI